MAEAVERNLEDSLNEILYMRKAKLFKKSEINEIIRKRRQHEYALQKRNKRVLDFDAYITTELILLKLLRFRRQETSERRFLDKIERSIISRLVRLHRQLCYRFQSRIDVWIRFIEFCKILGRHISVVRLWNRLLQVHGRTEPRLWASAAAYCLQENTTAKIRSNMRKLSTETSQLREQHKKLKLELQALTRYVNKKDQKKIENVISDIRQTKLQLSEATMDLARDRRLVWDRVCLEAIREARRLLTEGIALNPECKLLHLELVKLEACSTDFFKTRVLDRVDLSVEGDVDLPTDADTLRKRRKQLKRLKKAAAQDNARFMAEVTEDITFVTSGGALKLVMESVMERWPDDLETLESLQQIVSAVPNLVDNAAQTQLLSKLQELQNNPKQRETASEQTSSSNEDDLRKRLTNYTTQLYETVLCDGLSVALDLWNSWFMKDEHGPMKGDQFRFINPEIPEAVGLLRIRLLLHSLNVSWSIVSQMDTEVISDRSSRYRDTEAEQKTRIWLDSLATSPWGHLSPEFWISYIQFEEKSGDCTRIPAVKWRASKTLLPEPYNRFTALLNSDDQA
ncbi:hypothetical protein CRM22_011067 [Opisthorchis felineus]|uniref:U3 small nucleolar RNA-associated protein 6 N-terminal domain-containing protein n=3 Tax=Opisthorchis felineus TaxID=147828 RepID=A0A4S2KGC6_OPIFE|nr:hypothetical protein CRM22_011067 [Opisthorchis felineus]